MNPPLPSGIWMMHFCITWVWRLKYISCILVGNKLDYSWEVVGAPTTSSFSTKHLASMDWAKTTLGWEEKHFSFGGCVAYIRGLSLPHRVVQHATWSWGNMILNIALQWLMQNIHHTVSSHCFTSPPLNQQSLNSVNIWTHFINYISLTIQFQYKICFLII